MSVIFQIKSGIKKINISINNGLQSNITYTIYYRVSGQNFTDSIQFDISSGSNNIIINGTSLQYEIRDLLPGTEYTVRIHDSTGNESIELAATPLSKILIEYGLSGVVGELTDSIEYTDDGPYVLPNIIGNNYYNIRITKFGKKISQISNIFTYYVEPSLAKPERLRAIVGNGDGTAFIQWNDIADIDNYVLTVRKLNTIKTYILNDNNLSLNNLLIGDSYDISLTAISTVYGKSFTESLNFLTKPYSASVTFRWADNTFSAKKIAATQQGVYIIGTVSGISKIGSYYELESDTLNSYLVFYDLSGNVRWLRFMDGPSLCEIYDMKVDSTGITLIGYTTGSIKEYDTFPTDNNPTYIFNNTTINKAAIVLRYDLNGTYKWIHVLDDVGDQIGYSLTITDTYIYAILKINENQFNIQKLGLSNVSANVIDTFIYNNTEKLLISSDIFNNLYVATIAGGDLSFNILHIDQSNNIIWENTIRGMITVEKIIATTDAVYVFGYEIGLNDTYLNKFDRNGNLVLERRISEGFIIKDITIIYNSIYILGTYINNLYLHTYTLNGTSRNIIVLYGDLGNIPTLGLASTADHLYGLFELSNTMPVYNFGNGYKFATPNTILLAYNIIKQAPVNPIIDEIIVGESSVLIKWFPTINTTGYKLSYRNSLTGIWYGPFLTSMTEYSISSLINGRYEYRLSALNGSGESGFTSEFFTINTVVPPSNITADINDRHINLSWQKGLNTIDNLTYEIYIRDYRPSSQIQDTFRYIGVTGQTGYIISDLSNNKTYVIGIKTSGPFNKSGYGLIRGTPYSVDEGIIMNGLDVANTGTILQDLCGGRQVVGKFIDICQNEYSERYENQEKQIGLLINHKDIQIKTENNSRAILSFIDGSGWRMGIQSYTYGAVSYFTGMYINNMYTQSAIFTIRDYTISGHILPISKQGIVLSITSPVVYVYRRINGFKTLVLKVVTSNSTFIMGFTNDIEGRCLGDVAVDVSAVIAENGELLYEFRGNMQDVEIAVSPFMLEV